MSSETPPVFRIAVLASGNGSNLQAILDKVHGHDGIEVAGVASNKHGVRALERAESSRVPAAVFPRADYGDRVERDAAIGDWVETISADLVVLAGYMELVSAEFVRRFRGRIINIHPALLPSFPGLDGIGQALAYGVKVTGVTVHFVDEGVDTGPVILQRAVEVPEGATVDDLTDLIRPVEHDIFPEAIRLIAAGRVSIDPANSRLVRISS